MSAVSVQALARCQARRVEKLRVALEASKDPFTGSGAKRQKHLHAMYCEARRAASLIDAYVTDTSEATP